MRCLACHSENPPGNRFCEGCGAALSIICALCTYQNSAAARFCGSCGSALTGGRRAAGSPTLAAQAGWGELKHATVLIADIVRSTELVLGLDAEQAMERLRPAVMTMCAAVMRFDGIVVRTLGDGIMALFGAPSAREGHALLACESALAMREALLAQDADVAIRVGLHSGEVVLDAAFAGVSNERLAHGLALHLASRVQTLAEPGRIYLSEACYRLVRLHCDAEKLGRHALRGLPGEIEIFGLRGLKPAAASQQFRGVGLASFRGRDAELAALTDGLRLAETGAAVVIGIAGPPGAGKSRLCYEFAEWCRDRQIRVSEARAQPYGHARPLQPVLEFLRSAYFGIQPADGAAVARGRVAQLLSAIGPEIAADAPLMCEFLGIPSEGEPAVRLHPNVRRSRLLELVRQLVRRGDGSAAVIIIEDLHWLDEASGEFVGTMADAVIGTGTLLVVNYRPSFSAPWMRGPAFRQLDLADLSPTQTDALVQELVGERPALAAIRRQVAERSGGNPFYAEELVRSLAESGAIAGEPGQYVPGRISGPGALPATVQAVLGARIDRLDEADKSLLQIGAIIGKDIPVSVLVAVARQPEAAIETSLQRLSDAGLLQPQTTTTGRQYAFRHPLIQEVAYATQLRARRTGVHEAVAEAMQHYCRDRLDENAALIAYHYEAAGASLQAARFQSKAAIWVGATNTAQAIKHWQTVRTLLQDDRRAPDTDRLRIMASAQIAWLGWREGLTADAARPYIAEALDWARAIDDSLVSLLIFVDGRITGASGGPADHYVARVREALSLIDPARHPGRAATLHAALSQAYGWAGLFEPALAANDAALRGVAEVDRFDHQFLGYSAEHWIMSLRGRILVQLGRFAEAETCFAFMLGLEPRQVDPTVLFIVHLGYVDIAWCRGDAVLAARHAAQVGDLAQRHGSPYLAVFAHACRGIARAIAGDCAAAAAAFSDGLRYLRDARVAMDYEADLLAFLAEAQNGLGSFDKAIATAREAITIARRINARLPELRASIACGTALLHRQGAAEAPEAAEAGALFRHAEALLRQSGARVYDELLLTARALLEPQPSAR